MGTVPQYRVIMVVDIEGFGKRANPVQAWLRERMYSAMAEAMAAASVDVRDGISSDRGDGAFWLLPATISKVNLTGRFIAELCGALRAHARVSSEEAALRLRVVLHAGEVAPDRHGWVGKDLNTACRLVDLQALRDSLATSPAAPLVLAVTDSWYEAVVRHDYPGLERAEFHPVSFNVKEVRQRAWVRVPGVAHTPSPLEDPSTPSEASASRGGLDGRPSDANSGRFANARIRAERVYGGDHHEHRSGRGTR